MSEVWEFTVLPFLRSFTAATRAFSVTPASLSSFAVSSLPCMIESKRCSGLTNSSPNVLRIPEVLRIALFTSRLTDCAASPPVCFAIRAILSSSFVLIRLRLPLLFFNRNSIGPSLSSSIAFSKCWVSIYGLLWLKATCCACCRVSCALMVKLFKFIALTLCLLL
ncbi:hypothetical protein D3C86_1410470 [compost metagenome]